MLIPFFQRKQIVSLENFLDEQQIKDVHTHALTLPVIKGQTIKDYVHEQQNFDPDVHSTRKNKLKWYQISPETEWLYDRLASVAFDANSKFFHMDLTGGETIQYTIYNSGGDAYGQHIDAFFGGTEQRKLSCIVQLSDPSDYEGGDVKVYTTNFHTPDILSKQKGSIHLFHSNLIHEVTPVTKGTRKSLVWWVSGPYLK